MVHIAAPTQTEISNAHFAENAKYVETMLPVERLRYDIAKHKDNYGRACACIAEVDGFLSLAGAHDAEIRKHQAMYS
jgi:hypothetical protein